MATPRAHFQDIVVSKSGSDTPGVLGGASVKVCEPYTTTAIAETIYDSPDGAGTLSNPLTADSDGIVEFWLAAEKTVTLVVTKAGYLTRSWTVQVEHFTG